MYISGDALLAVLIFAIAMLWILARGVQNERDKVRQDVQDEIDGREIDRMMEELDHI